LLYATPFVLASFYFGGKLLRKILIDQLNKQLNVQVTVHSVNLNGLKTFPQLGLEMTNVRVDESMAHYNDYLLQARKVTVVFNPLKLVSGTNEIDRIQLDGGAIRLYTNPKGKTNFELFKPDEDSEDEPINIDLKKVLLNKFRCVYVDQQEDQSFNFKAEALQLSGKFNEERFELKSQGEALFDHLALGGVDYIKGKYAKLDLVLDVNQSINAYHISKGEIGLDQLKLDIQGDILLVENEPDLDLQISGQNIDIQSIISILPNNIGYDLRQLESKGDINVNGSILGKFQDDSWPKIDVDFQFNDAAIVWKEKELNAEKINLAGSLTNKTSDHSKALNLIIKLDELRFPKSSLKGGITVRDLFHPDITFNAQGLLLLEDFKGLLPEVESSQLQGKSLLNVKGQIPYNLKTEGLDFSASSFDGDIEIKEASLVTDERKLIDQLMVKTRIKGNRLTKTEIVGGLWNNDVNFSGEIDNWQGYAFRDQRLTITGELVSKSLDLDLGDTSTSGAEASSPQDVISIDYGFDAQVKIKADRFKWGMLKATNLDGDLRWAKDNMTFINVDFDAWGGHNRLDGELIETKERFLLNTSSISDSIKLERLLDEFENFEQEEFTSDILQGVVTTTLNLNLEFDRYFNVIEDEVRGLADVAIVDGRLRNYQPMEALSSFVELDDLRDIRFEELNNTIEIGNRQINIPTMAIKSNAMNLEIGGNHNFDNYMNYRMKIRVTELLAKSSGWVKRKKERQLDENRDGGLSAYILMIGTPDDLKIRYDRKAVKQKIKEEVKKERKLFFEELKREIRRQKSPTEDKENADWDE